MLGTNAMFTEFQITDKTPHINPITDVKTIRKNASSSGARAAKKGGAIKLDKLRKTASSYPNHEQDYIDAYTKAFNAASKTSSNESVVKTKAKHNGTNTAVRNKNYDEASLKISAEKFGELASVYVDCYVEAFNLKRKQIEAPAIKKSNEKVPSLKWQDCTKYYVTSNQCIVTQTQRLHILIDALESLSEFEIINSDSAEMIDNCSNRNLSNKPITHHYINSHVESGSCTESSSEEEASFAKIKQMRNFQK